MSSKKITIFLFVIYFLVLAWMLVFKKELAVFLTGWCDALNGNEIPFVSPAIYNGILYCLQIGFNVLCFIPFGIYMEMIFRKASWVQNLFVIGLISFSYKVVQYNFATGRIDIIDLLANGFGGAIGINIMYVLTSIWREDTYERLNFIASSFTFVILLVVVLTV